MRASEWPLREAPAHLLIARALHRCDGDEDGGVGSVGTLTRANTFAGAAWVSAAVRMSTPHGSLRACRSAGTLAPTLAMNVATALALLAISSFSTPELSAHCSRLALSPPPALAAAPLASPHSGFRGASGGNETPHPGSALAQRPPR